MSEAPTFVLEMPLLLGDDELSQIEKALEFARNIYNATLGTVLGRIQAMRQDRSWKEACSMPRGQERTEAFRALHVRYPLSDYTCQAIVQEHVRASGRSKELGSNQVAKIGTRVWKAVDEYLKGKHGRPRFKSKRQGLHSIEDKKGTAGLYFDKETKTLTWRKHAYRVIINPQDAYLQEALSQIGSKQEQYRSIKYCRLVRRTVQCKPHIYVQVVCEGHAPIKRIYAPKSETMGIDPSLQCINVYSGRLVGRIAISPNASPNEQKIRRIQRAMDRSRRATNPERFDEKGRVKKKTTHYVFKESKHYQRLRAQLAEMRRQETETRVNEHGELANLLLENAGSIRIEKNSYKAFQRNHFGKSIGKSGVGSFICQLISKAESAGCEVQEVSPLKFKFSQYDPMTDSYARKPLNQRWHRLDECNLIHRDTLSALLIACADLEKETHNPSRIQKILAGEKQRLIAAGLWLELASNDTQKVEFSPEPKARTVERVRHERFLGQL